MKSSEAIASMRRCTRDGAASIAEHQGPILPIDQLRKLAVRARTDNAAMNDLVMACAKLCHREANRQWMLWHTKIPLTVEFDDVFQEAIAGLIHAVSKYDADKLNPKTGEPYAFTTYATWWISQRAQRFCIDATTDMKIGRNNIQRGTVDRNHPAMIVSRYSIDHTPASKSDDSLPGRASAISEAIPDDARPHEDADDQISAEAMLRVLDEQSDDPKKQRSLQRRLIAVRGMLDGLSNTESAVLAECSSMQISNLLHDAHEALVEAGYEL